MIMRFNFSVCFRITMMKKVAESNSNIVYVMVYSEETVLDSIPSSSHREADYRIVTHVLDGISRGFTHIKVKENDTDIVDG